MNDQSDLSKYLEGLGESKDPHLKLSSRKGECGELIVDKIIDEWFPHHMIYKVIRESTAHLVDRLIIPKPTVPHYHMFLLEVKTKSRRTFYKDTGIDEHNYWRLVTWQKTHEAEVFLAFVDEGCGAIYGAFLKELMEPIQINTQGGPIQYPLFEMARNQAKDHEYFKSIVYFPTAKMGLCRRLPIELITRLRQMSARRYPYPSAAGGCDEIG